MNDTVEMHEEPQKHREIQETAKNPAVQTRLFMAMGVPGQQSSLTSPHPPSKSRPKVCADLSSFLMALN